MFKKIAVTAALALLATSASAADAAYGYFAGLDVGTSKLKGYGDRESSIGGFTGYTISDRISAEFGYRRLAAATFKGRDFTLKQSSISAVYTVPVSSGFSVLGRLGWNYVKSSTAYALTDSAMNYQLPVSDSKSNPLLGIGASYAITPKISARAEVQRPTDKITNVSFGVLMGFK